jgi:hypothetical protein
MESSVEVVFVFVCVCVCVYVCVCVLCCSSPPAAMDLLLPFFLQPLSASSAGDCAFAKKAAGSCKLKRRVCNSL